MTSIEQRLIVSAASKGIRLSDKQVHDLSVVLEHVSSEPSILDVLKDASGVDHPYVLVTRDPSNEALLSKRQREIYSFIQDQVSKNGYPPTVREIQKAMGLASPSTVHNHLVRMEEKGAIKRGGHGKPRTIGTQTPLLDDSIKAERRIGVGTMGIGEYLNTAGGKVPHV